jgi:hypothetical protein
MNKKKNRLSKLSIVAFVIVSFCVVSITTRHSQAQTLAVSSNTSFVGIIWSYFFPTASTDDSTETNESPVPMRTPNEDGPGGLRTPTPTPDPCDCTPRTRLNC